MKPTYKLLLATVVVLTVAVILSTSSVEAQRGRSRDFYENIDVGLGRDLNRYRYGYRRPYVSPRYQRIPNFLRPGYDFPYDRYGIFAAGEVMDNNVVPQENTLIDVQPIELNSEPRSFERPSVPTEDLSTLEGNNVNHQDMQDENVHYYATDVEDNDTEMTPTQSGSDKTPTDKTPTDKAPTPSKVPPAEDDDTPSPPVPPATCKPRQFFCQIYKFCYSCFETDAPKCAQCEKILNCNADDVACQRRETCKLCAGMTLQERASMPVCALSECTPS